LKPSILVQHRLASVFKTLALGFFWATLILIPFRLFTLLQARPIEAIYGGFTDFQLFLSDLFALFTLTFWGLSRLLSRLKLLKGPIFLTVPIIGLTLLALLSALGSIDPGLSIYHGLRLILLAGLYLFVLNEITSLGQLVIPLAIHVFIQSAIGIGQIFGQHSLGLRAIGEVELDPLWRGVSIVLSAERVSLRAYGLSDHPNILGGSLAFSLLLIIAWYIQKNKLRRVPLVAVMILGGIALFLTYSRSAWLAFLAGSALTAYIHYRKKIDKSFQRWLLLGLTLLIATVPILLMNADFLAARLGFRNSFQVLRTESTSLAERAKLFHAAVEVFTTNRVAGVGLGTLPQAIRINNPEFEFFSQPAHFALLVAAAEIGLFGALAYAVILVAPWLVLGFNSRVVMTEHLIGASAVLLAITVVGLFDYYPWLLAPGRLWQWIIWGLWARTFVDSQKVIPIV